MARDSGKGGGCGDPAEVSGRELVGFVPRELAPCLAPALDMGVVVVPAEGVYSEKTDEPTTGAKDRGLHRAWFRVDTGESADGTGPELIEQTLCGIPWWVVDKGAGA